MSTNISSLLQSYLAGVTNPQLKSALLQQLEGNLRSPTLQDIQQAMQRASASLTGQAQAVTPDFPTYTEGNEQDSPAKMAELELFSKPGASPHARHPEIVGDSSTAPTMTKRNAARG